MILATLTARRWAGRQQGILVDNSRVLGVGRNTRTFRPPPSQSSPVTKTEHSRHHPTSRQRCCFTRRSSRLDGPLTARAVWLLPGHDRPGRTWCSRRRRCQLWSSSDLPGSLAALLRWPSRRAVVLKAWPAPRTGGVPPRSNGPRVGASGLPYVCVEAGASARVTGRARAGVGCAATGVPRPILGARGHRSGRADNRGALVACGPSDCSAHVSPPESVAGFDWR